MHGLETAVIELANWMQILFEAASILVVTASGIAFAYAALSQWFAQYAIKPRQIMARFLIVALELQLAADIIATASVLRRSVESIPLSCRWRETGWVAVGGHIGHAPISA